MEILFSLDIFKYFCTVSIFNVIVTIIPLLLLLFCGSTPTVILEFKILKSREAKHLQTWHNLTILYIFLSLRQRRARRWETINWRPCIFLICILAQRDIETLILHTAFYKQILLLTSMSNGIYKNWHLSYF